MDIVILPVAHPDRLCRHRFSSPPSGWNYCGRLSPE